MFDNARTTPWSLLTLGCEPLGRTDWGNVDPAELRAAVRTALQVGIQVFDTADVYGLGTSELELSRALGADRHRVTIVTKGGVRWSDTSSGGRAPIWFDSSATYLASAIDASLSRLRLDTIPIYLVHAPDAITPIDDTLECLERAVEIGKIQAYGLSNFPFSTVESIVGRARISVVQGSLNLLSQPETIEGYAAIRSHGLTTLTYGPLAQGLLSGKYSLDSVFPLTDRRHRLKHFQTSHDEILAALGDVAADVNRSMAQVAIRWVIECGVSSSVVVGAKNGEQVIENQRVLDWSLTEAHHARLRSARMNSPKG